MERPQTGILRRRDSVHCFIRDLSPAGMDLVLVLRLDPDAAAARPYALDRPGAGRHDVFAARRPAAVDADLLFGDTRLDMGAKKAEWPFVAHWTVIGDRIVG